MSVVFHRAVFAGLLVAAAVTNIETTGRVDLDVHGAIIDAARRAGAVVREDDSPEPGQLGSSVFLQVPGCDGLVQVMPVSLNLQESPIFASTVKQGYVRRFLYIDRVWAKENRLGMRLEWLKRKAISLVGLSRYVTVPIALLIAEPAACRAYEAIDWASVWDRKGLRRTDRLDSIAALPKSPR